MFDEVLVPHNGSDETMRALRIGAGLAQSMDARLRILAYKRSADTPALTESVIQTALDVAAGYDLKASLTTLDPKRFASDSIISEARQRPNSIVCLAAHGRGRSQIFTGSVSAEVLLYGPGEAVLCGPKVENEFLEHGGPVIAAIDGTPESERIVEIADRWATALGVQLEVVNVQPPTLESELAPVGTTVGGRGSSRLDRELDGQNVLRGKPAKAIVKEARSRDASLIATATHMPLGIDRVLHGSVTDEIVRHSPVPVLACCVHPFWTARHAAENA